MSGRTPFVMPAKFRENVDFTRGSFRDSGDDTSIRDAEVQSLRARVRELEAEIRNKEADIQARENEIEWVNRQMLVREDIIETLRHDAHLGSVNE